MENAKPIETLGQAYEAGWRINARCAHGNMRGMKSRPECHTRAELDLDTLIWTRGEGFPLDRLESRLKCPNCWSRRVAIRFDQDANVKRAMKVTPT
jgi:Zn finger protein HypA/HybF involved in hydrogenase expression